MPLDLGSTITKGEPSVRSISEGQCGAELPAYLCEAWALSEKQTFVILSTRTLGVVCS